MGRLIENQAIKKRNPKDKIYCDEPYAQELYDKYCDHFEGKKLTAKDMDNGDLCQGTVLSITSGKILVQTENTQSVYLDLMRESKFLERQGVSSEIKPGMLLDIMVDSNVKGLYTGSMEKAFKLNLKKELMSALKNKNSAYRVKVKSINDGGFIVDLSGMDCFMPGSLAAANKITNFESMIGKEVYVMVENYLEKSDMFVVSNKRYIQSILPTKIKELNFGTPYQGTVTGSMPYGAFVEWDEVFTGLLHESEVDGVSIKELRPGDKIEFWVKEIKEGREGKDIRIILTQKGPSSEHKLYQEFKEQYENEEFDGRVKDIKPFGTFVELTPGVVGMLPPREFKKTGARKEGDSVSVLVKHVDVSTKKIHLKSLQEE